MSSLIINKIKSLSEGLIKILMPKSCIICNKIINDGFFCVKDFNELQFLTEPSCLICNHPFDYEISKNSICASCINKKPLYDKAISIIKYEDSSKRVIFDLKYKDQTHLSKFFANLIYRKTKNILSKTDFICFVPLYKKKIRKRKYNQSALISKFLSKEAHIPVIYDLLIKTKNTVAQSSLSKVQRRRNMAGVFKFNLKYLSKASGRNVALIDDVITTGSTVESCCKALREANVSKIYVLTLAKSVLDN